MAVTRLAVWNSCGYGGGWGTVAWVSDMMRIRVLILDMLMVVVMVRVVVRVVVSCCEDV